MISVEAVNHMSIPVNDLERAKKFYIELLGMKEIVDARTQRPPGAQPYHDPLADLLGVPDTPLCRLECGGLEVTLFQRPQPIDPKLPVELNGKFHYSYRMEWDKVAKLCENIEALREAGYNIPFGPVRRQLPAGPQYLNIYIFDPDGNLFEVLGWPPRTPESTATGVTGHPASTTA